MKMFTTGDIRGPKREKKMGISNIRTDFGQELLQTCRKCQATDSNATMKPKQLKFR